MAQHFLLSAAARTLSLKEIYKGGEDKARATFRKLRWASTNGEPVCPVCGCVDSKPIKGRSTYHCVACYKQYSVTSGTMFNSRKMPFTDLLAAVCIFVNAVKGISALQLSRDLDKSYKAAWVLAHKIARARLVADAKLFADEATHWDVLEAEYETGRINHSEAYSDHGKHTNFVESFGRHA